MNELTVVFPKSQEHQQPVYSQLDSSADSLGGEEPGQIQSKNPAVDIRFRRRRQLNRQADNSKVKRILFWNTFFETRNYEIQLGRKAFVEARCPVQNCVLTDDRNQLGSSDAILFHVFDFDQADLPNPQQRQSHQRYIFYNYETGLGLEDLPPFVVTEEDFFNWTMTYRRDSDIFDTRPYGILKRKASAPNPSSILPLPMSYLPPHPASNMRPLNVSLKYPWMAKKNKTVAWFVSNCQSDGRREDYFEQVGKHVPIDIYGNCGPLKCLPWKSPECNQLLQSYKFYVAAENGICADYVTEKFYRALSENIVPIVYGGADYSAYAPPRSFIHVGDFKSPKALADYLRLLDENDGLYLQYFDWKKEYQVVDQPLRGWCDLCAKLHDPQLPAKSYQNVTSWWFHPNISCLTGHDFLQQFDEFRHPTRQQKIAS